MKKHEDAAVILAVLAHLRNADDDQLIDSSELAVLLRTTRGRIHQLRHCTPEKLPQPLTLFERRLVWRLGAVREWIRSIPIAARATVESVESINSNANGQESAKRRPGKPRNARTDTFLSEADRRV
ncbi:hypothetical protein [Burkholderia vietnamiensis]|uniref:hypothetical protein n=1 Tax=Burkholderia vietnamiensis TaxID=60552 RepID=UPI001CF0F4FE|nr:hypothetical protein [Burkholderia vietnamiensis]MCA8270618.1 hypothetical protein [Burkholderia vietnamiensis]UKV76643.1 hypothetical protein FOC29_20135 [Burkholderia vietnamiensis]